MSRVRDLVRELHRRSVWQVLGVYLVGSWVALQVVDVLTSNYGLPDWVPPFALVLLVIGLPVVLATAVVQEGAPSRETWRGGPRSRTEPTALLEGEPRPLFSDEERAGEGADLRDEERPGRLRSDAFGGLDRLLTWRNAVLGGVAAAALLVLAVAVYFTMWATGVGPVGSLVAQGVLDEREEVVLAAFESSTPDPTLGEVVTDAFRVDLVRSPILAPVDPTFVDGVLERMDRDPGEPLTPGLAREIAQREGIKAVVQGEVAAAGSRYVLTTSLVAAEDGETLAAFRETAESPEAIIDAVDRLSQRLREKAGESLPSIRAGEPLRDVTTGSLDALRLYSRALRALEEGQGDRAVGLLEEAVEVDPEFAMAHRQLGAIYRNRGETEQATEAVTRAYELRNRLTDRERYHATAIYHQFVTGDRERTVQAYRNVLELHPGDGRALNNLGVLYGDAGEPERAVEMYRRAIGAADASGTAYGNLIQVLINLGRVDEALEVVEEFGERYGHDHQTVRFFAMRAAAFAGAWERADSLAGLRLGQADRSTLERAYTRVEASIYAAGAGRLGDAAAGLEEALRSLRDGDPEGARLFVVAMSARVAQLDEGDAAAVSTLHRLMTPRLRTLRDTLPRAFVAHAELYAGLGRPDSARALLARVPVAGDEGPGPDSVEVMRVRAHVALAEDRLDEAVEAARRQTVREDCPRCGLQVLARAHERAGRPDSAAAAYRAYVDAPDWDAFPDYLIDRSLFLERLCRLRDELGQRERALESCRRFVELWSGADPELQPRVEEARERIRRLSGAAGAEGADSGR